MKKSLYLLGSLLVLVPSLMAQTSQPTPLSLAESFAHTVMQTYPDSIVVKKFLQHMLQDKEGNDPAKRKAVWNYEAAVVLKGFERLWQQTHKPLYFDYTKKMTDQFINADGSIRTYELNDYNSDQVTGGLQLLMLYKATKEEKYKKAADLLRRQLTWQPRTKEGGFWHKHKYPYQMWLDCMYMLNLYYAEYCHDFDTPAYFADVANQFIYLYRHNKRADTGLLCHGWDESRGQPWADARTGQSPEVWSRAMGWYVMGLVDVLEVFPKNHPKRAELIQILQKIAPVLANYQDKTAGVWYQITDKATWKGNYLEASGSTMFAYALAKGVRKGYLPKQFATVAQNAFEGILKNFITYDNKGLIHIHRSCSGAGLGGTPYRSGTFDYYINEPIRSDDLKTVGPLIGLMLEMEAMGYKPMTAIKQE